MKNILLITFLLLTTTLFSQIVNIPDPIFKGILLTQFDANNDGEIQTYEVNSVTELLVETSNINDLTGIAAFTSLEHLNCMENNLTTLDVSSNNALINLECQNNLLNNLIINDNLQSLNCAHNNLINLNLANATNLDTVFCNNNEFTSLDFSNTPLVFLTCHDNLELTYINLKNGANQGFGFTSGDFANLPNLQNVCVDDLAFTDLTNFILNEVGHAVSFQDNCAVLGVASNNLIDFSVQPNPVSNTLKINTDQIIKEVSIYNTLGELIATISKKDAIAVGSLANGLYFIKIITNTGKIATTKFIKN